MAVSRGATARRLLQFVASGLLGARAFQGGIATAALGLLLHYLIAIGVVTVFYMALRYLAFVRQQPLLWGVAYGLLVYAVMNLVVLPLSAAKPRHALLPDLLQMGIHMFIIGVPAALLLRRFAATRYELTR